MEPRHQKVLISVRVATISTNEFELLIRAVGQLGAAREIAINYIQEYLDADLADYTLLAGALAALLGDTSGVSVDSDVLELFQEVTE